MNFDTVEIKDICKQIADVYKDKMVSADYNQNGDLYNFNWITEVNGNLFELYFNLPDYWQYAEYGRGPGKFPPPDAILKWIQFKRLVPSTKGKAISTKQLVYVVSRKIALEGTEGKHLLQQTIDSPDMDNLIDKLTDAITDKLLEEIEKQLEEI